MKEKNLLHELNLFRTCGELNVPLWSCPRFVFTIMGAVNIASILATYYIGQYYAEPELIILIVIGLTVFLLIITYTLVGAFDRVVESRRAEILRAKEILDLKDQFVYIAIHNLRGGATAIKWGLRTLESQIKHLTKDDRDVFEIMRAKNEKLLRLVRNILLITRIESGKLDMEVNPSAVEPIIRELADVSRTFASFGVKSNFDIAPDTGSLAGDAQYVREILSLLIENALLYADKQDPQVGISASRKKDTVIIAISNNGPGIDPGNFPHVFTKFWRRGKTDVIEQTGFGLYLAKELTTLMKGQISFTSEPGKTVFTVTFPAA